MHYDDDLYGIKNTTAVHPSGKVSVVKYSRVLVPQSSEIKTIKLMRSLSSIPDDKLENVYFFNFTACFSAGDGSQFQAQLVCPCHLFM